MRIPIGLALLVATLVPGDDPAVEPSPREFLVIPLRVHVLSAEDLPDVDCKLTDDDIRRVLGKVNAVWRPAGIHFGLERIVREPAANQDRFRALSDEGKRPVPLPAFRMLAPEPSRKDEGADVYYIHRFAVNGVYLGDRMAFVQETAQLHAVEGGIDEPLPRVTAHELGHALGLPHRQARTNLLASGTTGTALNTAEARIARAKAETFPGAMTRADLEKKAEAADGEEAERLRGWIAALDAPPVKIAEPAKAPSGD